MKDHQQTVEEMMKDRAVPVWHLQTAQNKTSFLYCVCKENLEGVRGDVGPEPAHRISRGVIRQQPATSILQKTSSQEVNSQSAYSHYINSRDALQNYPCKSSITVVCLLNQNKNRFRGILSSQCICYCRKL